MKRIWRSLPLAVVLGIGCAQIDQGADTTAINQQLLAEPWPEADKLFYNNPDTPQWRGADVANSVALDQTRTLWVFGDTLLREPGVNRCERFNHFNILVHNSLALQRGTDPTTAQISHFWREDKFGKPESFFSPEGNSGDWFWMGGVSVLQNHVLVFLMHARSSEPQGGHGSAASCAGLNFEILGWSARMAKITAETPDQWQWREVKLPADNYWQQILTGSSTVLADHNYLYAWSAGPASFGGNPIYLARWPLEAALDADLSEPHWYIDGGWQAQTTMADNPPTAIVADGNNEISIAKDLWATGEKNWWWLQSKQIVNSSLCYRNASSPLGFGQCRALLKPSELTRYPDSKLLVYAVKIHPALSGAGQGAAIATYVVNSCDATDIQDKCDLYYPRFFKLRLDAR